MENSSGRNTSPGATARRRRRDVRQRRGPGGRRAVYADAPPRKRRLVVPSPGRPPASSAATRSLPRSRSDAVVTGTRRWPPRRSADAAVGRAYRRRRPVNFVAYAVTCGPPCRCHSRILRARRVARRLVPHKQPRCIGQMTAVRPSTRPTAVGAPGTTATVERRSTG